MKKITLTVLLLIPLWLFGQCIPDKYQQVGNDCQFILPDYRDSIVVKDNCCLEYVEQLPIPGEIVSLGDTLVVVLIAVDCFNNMAKLEFNIIPIDTIPPVFICDSIPIKPPDPEPIVEKRRVIILTDPNVDPTKETDDKMSLVRYILYSNEFDTEGLIATCSHNLHFRYIEPIHNVIDTYESVLPNLNIHDSGWPDPDQLRAVTALGPEGYGVTFALNEEPISDGAKLIINAIHKDDSRPIWIPIWGDGAVIAQALEHIKATEGEQAALDASDKLRILDNAGQDDSGAWLKAAYHYPQLFYNRWVQGSMAMDSISDTPTGVSWFPFCGECAKGDVSYTSDYWIDKNIQPKGPLGAEYPDRRYLKEGDSPTLLYLIPNGFGDPEEPGFGSWGGRMTHTEVEGIRSVRDPLNRPDEILESTFDPYFMNPLSVDTWNEYTNKWTTMFRHWPEFQNDFHARIDWSITPDYLNANHPPRPFIGNDGTENFVYMDVVPGETIQISAAASIDPDDFYVNYHWYQYKEAGTFDGDIVIMEPNGNTPSFYIPANASGTTIHIILSVSDTGTPTLTRYRRIILNVA